MARKFRRAPKVEAAKAAATTRKANLARWWRPGCLGVASALLVATPLVPSERTELTGNALPYVMLWLLLALGWFAGAGLLGVRLGRWGWIDLLACGLSGWHALSGLVMMHYGAPRLTINAIWTWVSFAVIVVLLRQLLRSRVEAKAFCAVMIGMAVCLSAMSFYQLLLTYPQKRAQYEENPEALIGTAGTHAPPGSAARRQLEARLYSNEPIATFALTNSLAGFLAPWLVFLLGIAATGNNSRAPAGVAGGTRFWIGLVSLVSIIAVCLFLTKSRTAWLATAMGCAAGLLILLWRRGQRRHATLVAGGGVGLVAVAVAMYAVGMFPSRFASAAALSLQYRFEYWQSTLAMIGDYPLLGCGPGNFQDYYTTYKLPQASEAVADPHNFALEVAATAGLPALVLLLGLLALVGVAARREGGVYSSPRSGHRNAPRNAPRNAAPGNKDQRRPHEPVHVRSVYAGLPLGCILAIPLGWVTGYPAPLLPLLLGGAGAAVCLWLLHGWTLHGGLPRWLPLTAMGVLLVNLLAAGGISFPGVGMTLWVLIAVITFDDPAPLWQLTKRRALAWLAPACAVLLVACHVSAYQPALRRESLLSLAADAQRRGNIAAAAQYAEQAAQADPWSAAPHLHLARLYFDRWRAEADSSAADIVQRIFRHSDAALQRDRHSYLTESAVGYLHLSVQTRQPTEKDSPRKAVRHFQRAVHLYPADAMTHAHLSYALGDGELAAAAAEEALRLDALCPHEERKLAHRRLFAEISTAADEDALVQLTASKSAKEWMLEIRNRSESSPPLGQMRQPSRNRFDALASIH